MTDRLAVLDDDPAICEIVRLVGSEAGFDVQSYRTVTAFRADIEARRRSLRLGHDRQRNERSGGHQYKNADLVS